MSLHIRHGNESDLDALIDMGARFHRETPYAQHFALDADRVREMCHWLFTNGAVLVATIEGAPVGMMGLVVTPHLMAHDTVASEVFWWVEPHARGVGLALLRFAERWAREQHATVLQVVAPSERAERLYERMGFARLETTYSRRLE